MSTHSEYILEILRKEDFIHQWIQGKYKEKPLIIYGCNGVGKTSLANYILQSFIKIEINIYTDRIISPTNINRTDKFFRLKKPLRFNTQIIRPN